MLRKKGSGQWDLCAPSTCVSSSRASFGLHQQQPLNARWPSRHGVWTTWWNVD
jgi:hypothetical protein